MMTTDKELDQGYSVCKECNEGVLLHQSGFEVELHRCPQCKCEVADRAEFFKFQTGMEVLSK